MSTNFSSVTARINGTTFIVDWVNALRTAGIAVENQSIVFDPKITKGFADFSTAGLTNDIEFHSLLAKQMMTGAIIKHTTAFAGTGITAVKMTLGLSGALDKYSNKFDIFQAVGNTVFQNADFRGIEDFGSATSLRIALTAVGANLDQLSAGSVDIYPMFITLP